MNPVGVLLKMIRYLGENMVVPDTSVMLLTFPLQLQNAKQNMISIK